VEIFDIPFIRATMSYDILTILKKIMKTLINLEFSAAQGCAAIINADDALIM